MRTLAAYDSRSGGWDNHFRLTQEFLAQMLGSRRVSVTQAAPSLQELGAISYQRGEVTVLDRNRLLSRTCACYDVVTGAFAGLYRS